MAVRKVEISKKKEKNVFGKNTNRRRVVIFLLLVCRALSIYIYIIIFSFKRKAITLYENVISLASERNRRRIIFEIRFLLLFSTVETFSRKTSVRIMSIYVTFCQLIVVSWYFI